MYTTALGTKHTHDGYLSVTAVSWCMYMYKYTMHSTGTSSAICKVLYHRQTVVRKLYHTHTENDVPIHIDKCIYMYMHRKAGI